jgi:hypothetical protein
MRVTRQAMPALEKLLVRPGFVLNHRNLNRFAAGVAGHFNAIKKLGVIHFQQTKEFITKTKVNHYVHLNTPNRSCQAKLKEN